MLLDYGHDPADPATPAPASLADETARQIGRLRNVRVVHGHFPIRKYDAVQHCARVVMLRNPVENIISIYYFWDHLARTGYRDGHALFKRFCHERPSLVEFAQFPTFRHLMSSTYFGGYRMQNFDIIGDFADRTTYCEALSQLMNVRLDASIAANRSPLSDVREDVSRDVRIVRELHDLLRDDIAFYERWAGYRAA